MQLAEVLNEFPPDLQGPVQHLVTVLLTQMGVTREDFSELKEIVRNLADAQDRTEQRVEELANALKDLADAQKDLADAQKDLADAQKDLADAQKNTEVSMNLGFKRLNDRITALGGRWGIQTESTMRNTLQAVLGETDYTVKRGYYGGREVDIIIRGDGMHILLEITSSIRRGAIAKYVASADDYEAKTGIAPHIMVAAMHVPPVVIPEINAAGRPIELLSADEEEASA